MLAHVRDQDDRKDRKMDNAQQAAHQLKCQAATTLEAEILESATQNLTAYRNEREAAGNPSEWKEPA
jgi:hypothetical protein